MFFVMELLLDRGKIINMLAGPFSIESFSFFKMQIKTIKKKLSVSFDE